MAKVSLEVVVVVVLAFPVKIIYNVCRCVQQRRLDNRSGMRQLQMKAAQSIKRARALLREMDTLRNQVADVDLQTFDNSMNLSRRMLLDAIDMFKSYIYVTFST